MSIQNIQEGRSVQQETTRPDTSRVTTVNPEQKLCTDNQSPSDQASISTSKPISLDEQRRTSLMVADFVNLPDGATIGPLYENEAESIVSLKRKQADVSIDSEQNHSSTSSSLVNDSNIATTSTLNIPNFQLIQSDDNDKSNNRGRKRKIRKIDKGQNDPEQALDEASNNPFPNWEKIGKLKVYEEPNTSKLKRARKKTPRININKHKTQVNQKVADPLKKMIQAKGVK